MITPTRLAHPSFPPELIVENILSELSRAMGTLSPRCEEEEMEVECAVHVPERHEWDIPATRKFAPATYVQLQNHRVYYTMR